MAKKQIKIEANELSKEAKVSMKTRIIAGIIGISICFPLLILGDYFFLGFLAFIVAISIFEIIRAARKRYSIWLYIVSYIFAMIISFWPLIHSLFDSILYTANLTDTGVLLSNWRLHDCFIDYSLVSKGLVGLQVPVTALVAGLLLLFAVVVLDPGFEVRDACFVFTMVLLVSLGCQSFLYLRFLPVSNYHLTSNPAYFNLYDNFQSSMLFMYVIIGTFVTDIGAYFVGVFFGKHKMNPRISPKKTWEGFIGGIVISAVVSFGIAAIADLCGNPIAPNMDLAHWYNILIISLVMPFISVLGDFIFSSIKRYYGIKDFGKILPGHGGAIDRIDSFLVTGIVVALVISLVIYWA